MQSFITDVQTHSFQLDTRRRIRQITTDFVCNSLRTLLPSMRDEQLGYIVRYLHIASFFYILSLALWIPRQYLPLILSGIITLAILQYYMNGCVITKIEQTLLHNKTTFFDGLLCILNLDVTPGNAMFVTHIITGTVVGLVLYRYFFTSTAQLTF